MNHRPKFQDVPYACERPEYAGRGAGGAHVHFDGSCRACLTAWVSAAVMNPNASTVYGDGSVLPNPVAAMNSVRLRLDEFDPLRVRAERVLVPLIEGAK